MTSYPFLPPRSLARPGVDRNYRARGADGSLRDVLARSSARVVVEHRGALLVSRGRLHTLSAELFAEHRDALTGTAVYLGQAEGADWIGVSLDDAGRSHVDSSILQAHTVTADDFLLAPAAGAEMEDPTWIDLRALALSLGDVDAGLATTIVALGNWHRTHTHSPRTGGPTVVSHGGWVRTDPATGTEHFPRTDPAVIMAIFHGEGDDERILLGNNALWPQGRYSLLAGFVEPGETLEQAVAREAFEESGVHCDTIRYLGSQPWPFPCSLMLGFAARARSEHVEADSDEIRRLAWFSRAELRAGQRDGSVVLPGEVSIAGQIVTAWLEGSSLL